MTKNFHQVEDVLADDSFLAWYNKESEQKVREWEEWLANNPGQHSLVDEAIAFMNEWPHEIKVNDDRIGEKLHQLHERIGDSDPGIVRMRSTRRRWMSAAAAVLVLLIGGYVLLKTGTHSNKKLCTAYGQVTSNQLPDGSTMILNANSTAKVSDGWQEGKDREVWLEGEAFFHVKKTPQRSKFIVHTGQLDVIVTGTQFNVLRRDNKTTVLLTEGSVTLRTADGKELFMKPGEYVEMNDTEIARKTTKEETVLAWRDNKLFFDNTPVKDVLKTLYTHYGVKITADSAVAVETLTGIMPNDNLDVVLEAIGLALDAKITKTDKGIVLTANK